MSPTVSTVSSDRSATAALPTSNWLTASARVVGTADAGFGAEAVEPIPAGAQVARFGGWLTDRAGLNDLSDDQRARSLQVGWDLFLASSPEREDGDCINHSCDPNCGLIDATTLVARRPISPGERLTYDYATSDSCDYDEFRCACGSAWCRGLVTGADWRDPVLQARLAGWFSPYLAASIELAA